MSSASERCKDTSVIDDEIAATFVQSMGLTMQEEWDEITDKLSLFVPTIISESTSSQLFDFRGLNTRRIVTTVFVNFELKNHTSAKDEVEASEQGESVRLVKGKLVVSTDDVVNGQRPSKE